MSNSDKRKEVSEEDKRLLNLFDSIKFKKPTIEELLEKAEAGDTSAMLSASIAYYKGEIVEVDENASLHWLVEAVKLEDPEAEEQMAELYANGVMLEKNLEKAVLWYRKSADHGRCTAMTSLGYALLNGNGVEQDIQEGLMWIQRGALEGDDKASIFMGNIFEKGEIVQCDPEKAFTWYSRAAHRNSPHGMYMLGLAYENGLFVESDLNEAFTWYENAAKFNHPDACYKMGLRYSRSDLFEDCDYKEALRWFRISAKGGNAAAMYLVCKIIENELVDGEDDGDEALDWLIEAAEKEYPDALYDLGMLYLDQEASEHQAKGVELLDKAAQQDHVPAFFPLAQAYYEGKGIEKDKLRAVCLLMFPVMKGYPDEKRYLEEKITSPDFSDETCTMEQAIHVLEEQARKTENAELYQVLVKYFASCNTEEELEKAQYYGSKLSGLNLNFTMRGILSDVSTRLEQIKKKQKGFLGLFRKK